MAGATARSSIIRMNRSAERSLVNSERPVREAQTPERSAPCKHEPVIARDIDHGAADQQLVGMAIFGTKCEAPLRPAYDYSRMNTGPNVEVRFGLSVTQSRPHFSVSLSGPRVMPVRRLRIREIATVP
jgi:hypothetical protein